MKKLKYMFYDFKRWLFLLKHPEAIIYGGSLKRETALRSVGKGWSEIINNLYDAKPKGVRVTQVKEKFGGLRFYAEREPQWYYDLISFYEDKSYCVCEKCGKKGSCRSDLSWILTLCDEHYEEIVAKRRENES